MTHLISHFLIMKIKSIFQKDDIQFQPIRQRISQFVLQICWKGLTKFKVSFCMKSKELVYNNEVIENEVELRAKVVQQSMRNPHGEWKQLHPLHKGLHFTFTTLFFFFSYLHYHKIKSLASGTTKPQILVFFQDPYSTHWTTFTTVIHFSNLGLLECCHVGMHELAISRENVNWPYPFDDCWIDFDGVNLQPCGQSQFTRVHHGVNHFRSPPGFSLFFATWIMAKLGPFLRFQDGIQISNPSNRKWKILRNAKGLHISQN